MHINKVFKNNRILSECYRFWLQKPTVLTHFRTFCFSRSHQPVSARERPGGAEGHAAAAAEEAVGEVRQHRQSAADARAHRELPGLSARNEGRGEGVGIVFPDFLHLLYASHHVSFCYTHTHAHLIRCTRIDRAPVSNVSEFIICICL